MNQRVRSSDWFVLVRFHAKTRRANLCCRDDDFGRGNGLTFMQDIIYFKERADTKISILSVIYVTSILANLAVGYRYISIGVLAQSGGIFIFPISFIISDIVTEVYGSELAKKLVIYGIIGQVIFASYAYLVVHIPSPSFLHNKEVYYQVFNPYINFALASSISDEGDELGFANCGCQGTSKV